MTIGHLHLHHQDPDGWVDIIARSRPRSPATDGLMAWEATALNKNSALLSQCTVHCVDFGRYKTEGWAPKGQHSDEPGMALVLMLVVHYMVQDMVRARVATKWRWRIYSKLCQSGNESLLKWRPWGWWWWQWWKKGGQWWYQKTGTRCQRSGWNVRSSPFYDHCYDDHCHGDHCLSIVWIEPILILATILHDHSF